MYSKNRTYSINEIYTLDSIRYCGKNSCIAILDTGIYPHSDLNRRIVCFKDFVNERTSAYDDNSHGTHVAGIAAGDGTACRRVIRGVAPECRIAALKILDKKGNGEKEALLRACSWLASNYKQNNIRIVNISIGSETSDCEDEKTEVADAIEELWQLGLTVVVSAGNAGPGPGTVTFPGTCQNVITVGSDSLLLHSDEHGHPMVSHSGEGPTKCNIPKPDLLAPGHNIISCHNKYNGYTVKSGTSMSTPVVSGSIALFLEKYPFATNAQIRECLTASATDLGLPRNRQGAGLLNIKHFLMQEPV